MKFDDLDIFALCVIGGIGFFFFMFWITLGSLSLALFFGGLSAGWCALYIIIKYRLEKTE